MADGGKRPAWFKVPATLQPTLEFASDKQIGRAMRAAMAYFLTGEESRLDPMAQIVFANLKFSIDETLAAYQRNVEKGKKGGRPRKDEKLKNLGFSDPTNIEVDAEAEAEAEVDAEVDAEADAEVDAEAEAEAEEEEENIFQTKTNSFSLGEKRDAAFLGNAAKQPCIAPKTEAAIPKSDRIPTVGQVEAYCRELGLQVDAAAFVDYYEAKGWMLGANPMRDWRAAARSWNRRKEQSHKKDDFAFLDHIGIRL